MSASIEKYERCAQTLLRVNGFTEPVRVEWVGNIQTIDAHSRIAGDASWDAESKSFVIRVCYNLGADEGHTFAHELAHVLLRHVDKKAVKVSPLVTRARIYFVKTGQSSPEVQAKHDRQENEANALADRIVKEWGL